VRPDGLGSHAMKLLPERTQTVVDQLNEKGRIHIRGQLCFAELIAEDSKGTVEGAQVAAAKLVNKIAVNVPNQPYCTCGNLTVLILSGYGEREKLPTRCCGCPVT